MLNLVGAPPKLAPCAPTWSLLCLPLSANWQRVSALFASLKVAKAGWCVARHHMIFASMVAGLGIVAVVWSTLSTSNYSLTNFCPSDSREIRSSSSTCS